MQIVINDPIGFIVLWVVIYMMLGIIKLFLDSFLYKSQRKKESYQGKVSWNRIFISFLGAGVIILLFSSNIASAFNFDPITVIISAFVFIAIAVLVFNFKIKGVSK